MALIHVDTPRTFNFLGTLLSHGWIQLAPFAHDGAFKELRRIERLGDGRIVELVFSSNQDDALRVSIEGFDENFNADARAEIEQIARRIFNVDIDLGAFYDLLEGRARYGWVRQHGGGRLLRAPTVWEDLAKTLLTTNTSWSMTRRMVERLTTLGDSHASGAHAFPTPEQVAMQPFENVANQVGAGYRNAYLYELAVNIAEGHLDVEAWVFSERPSNELYRELSALKGFGPYAAGAALKLLGRFNYLALDSVGRSTFTAQFAEGESVSDNQIRAHYEPYGRWQGLVIWMDVMRDWFLEHHARQGGENVSAS